MLKSHDVKAVGTLFEVEVPANKVEKVVRFLKKQGAISPCNKGNLVRFCILLGRGNAAEMDAYLTADSIVGRALEQDDE